MSSLSELTAAYLAGKLSDEQSRELVRRLSAEQADVDAFAFDCFLEHELRRRLGQHQVHQGVLAILQGESFAVANAPQPDAATSPPGAVARDANTASGKHRRSVIDRLARQIYWSQHPAYFLATVVVICIGLWMLFATLVGPNWRQRIRTADGPGPNVTLAHGVVARLISVDRAKWTGQAPTGRGMVPGQRLALASGLAEIRYETGAKVILTGPAEFWVGGKVVAGERQGAASNEQGAKHQSEIMNPKSHNSGYLALGKLVARVEGQRAKGFTIETPLAAVEDLGTEFAVDVDREGRVQLYVFEGSVQVAGVAAAGRNRQLRAGQGIGWNAAGPVHTLSQPLGERYASVARPLRRDHLRRSVSVLDAGLVLRRFRSGTPRVIYPGNENQIVAAPASLSGLTAIVPSRGAGNQHPGVGYRFRVNEPARLYLLVHDRGDHAPYGWQRTQEAVTWTVAGQTHTDTVYTRLAEPSDVVIPPHQWQDKQFQYGVPHVCLVAPLAESADEPSGSTEDKSS